MTIYMRLFALFVNLCYSLICSYSFTTGLRRGTPHKLKEKIKVMRFFIICCYYFWGKTENVVSFSLILILRRFQFLYLSAKEKKHFASSLILCCFYLFILTAK